MEFEQVECGAADENRDYLKARPCLFLKVGATQIDILFILKDVITEEQFSIRVLKDEFEDVANFLLKNAFKDRTLN